MFEAGHWVHWFWGLLGEILVLANVIYYLWLGSGESVWSYKAIHSCGCLCWPCMRAGKSKQSTEADICQHCAWSRSANVPRQPEICLHLPLPSGCLLGSVTERASGGMWVVLGTFSEIHQVGVSNVHQNDTNSNLLSVLCLRPLSKYPRVCQL